MTNNQMIQKFRELWGNYPRTKNENSLGLDYLVEQLLLSSLEQKDQEKDKALEDYKKEIKSQQQQAESDGRFWHYLEIEDLEKRVAEKALEDYKKELREKITKVIDLYGKAKFTLNAEIVRHILTLLK